MRSWTPKPGAANFRTGRYRIRGSVYFVQSPSDGCIKIGFARELKYRLTALDKQTGESLRRLGMIESTQRLERELHEWFSASRLVAHPWGREWFHPVDELTAWIGTFAKPVSFAPCRAYVRRVAG